MAQAWSFWFRVPYTIQVAMFWNVGKNHWIKDSVKFEITRSVETFRLLATRGFLREIELRFQLAQHQLRNCKVETNIFVFAFSRKLLAKLTNFKFSSGLLQKGKFVSKIWNEVTIFVITRKFTGFCEKKKIAIVFAKICVLWADAFGFVKKTFTKWNFVKYC